MISLLAVAESIAAPVLAGGGLTEALLPTLPRLAVRTVNPANAASTIAELRQMQEAYEGPKRETLVEVIYTPGTYHNVGIGQDMVLSRSSTGDPADVVIETDLTAGGVLHWFGGPTWLRGLTLRSLPSADDGPGAKYPLHMTNGGVLSLVDCHLEARNPDSDGGNAVIGMDAGDGLEIAFVRCRFSNLVEGDHWTNIHGGGIGTQGQRITFYECIIEGDNTQPVSFSGDPAERTDIYLIGGNVLAGDGVGNVEFRYYDAPLTVGGFSARQRITLGITDAGVND